MKPKSFPMISRMDETFSVLGPPPKVFRCTPEEISEVWHEPPLTPKQVQGRIRSLVKRIGVWGFVHYNADGTHPENDKIIYCADFRATKQNLIVFFAHEMGHVAESRRPFFSGADFLQKDEREHLADTYAWTSLHVQRIAEKEYSELDSLLKGR